MMKKLSPLCRIHLAKSTNRQDMCASTSRSLSTTPSYFAELPRHRTAVVNPAELSLKDDGQWYTIREDDFKTLKLNANLPKYLRRQSDTFGECALMIRRPFLDVKQCMGAIHQGMPTIRFLLYGYHGTGKMATLCQLFHYGYSQGWIVVFIPSPMMFTKDYKEVAVSSWNPKRVDLPQRAAEVLENFKRYNSGTISLLESQLKITKDYVWSKRETTPVDSPLMEMVDFGINRAKYASDCVGALFRELKQYSTNGQAKVMVVVPDNPSMFYDSEIPTEDGSLVAAGNISLIHHFKDMLKADWNGGCVVTSVTGRVFRKLTKETPHYPWALLGKEGFEWMDPFVPVDTNNYSEKELHSCLDYFEENRWINHPQAHTDSGRKQLAYVSNFNPYNLERLCAFL